MMMFNALVIVFCLSFVSSEQPTIQDEPTKGDVTEDAPVKVEVTDDASAEDVITNNAAAEELNVDDETEDDGEDVPDIELSDLVEAAAINDMLSDLDEAPKNVIKDAWWGRRRSTRRRSIRHIVHRVVTPAVRFVRRIRFVRRFPFGDSLRYHRYHRYHRRPHSPSKTLKGGTAIYTDNLIDTINRDDLIVDSIEFESSWVEVKNKNSKNIIVGMYIQTSS